MSRRFVSLVTAGLLLCGMGRAGAAELLVTPTAERFVGAAPAAAARFLDRYADALAIRGLTLEARAHLALAGTQVVRYAQTHAGVPVLGTSVVVRIDEEGRVLSTGVEVERDLSVSTTPAIDARTARQLVASELGRALDERTPAMLAILRGDGGLLVWRIDAMASGGARRFLVDAHSGEMLQSYSLRRDDLPPVPNGRVFAINWQQSSNIPVDLPLEQLTPPAVTEPPTPQHLNGFAGNMVVYNYKEGDVEAYPDPTLVVEQTLEPSDEQGNFLYDPPANPVSLSDGFAQVNIYYHLARIRKFFNQTLNVPMDAAQWSLLAVANYGPPPSNIYYNAFFSPLMGDPAWGQGKLNAIVIGQGPEVDLAYDSDVFLHEFTHFVNYNAIGFDEGVLMFDTLGIVVMPGAIDEGSSDYFACSVNDDPVEGEASLGASARYLDPSLDPSGSQPGRCPDDVIGESHEDGKLVGIAAWSIRKLLGKEKSDKLIWLALSALPANPALGDFGENVLAAMEDPGLALEEAQKQSIRDVLSDLGLDDCKRILDVTPSKSRKVLVIGLGTLAQMMQMGSCTALRSFGLKIPSLFHFKHTPQPDDKLVRFKVTLDPVTMGMGDQSLDWSIYVRQGAEVTFKKSGGGMMPPDLSRYDYALEHITTTEAELVINETMFPDMPFDPTQTYDLLIQQQNCPTVYATVTVSAEAESSATTDGGVTDDGGDGPAADEGKGCSCRLSRAGSLDGGPWILGLVFVLLAVRRRSRSR